MENSKAIFIWELRFKIMETFLLKSQNSTYTALHLIESQDKRFFAASVHCSYYSLFQFILYYTSDLEKSRRENSHNFIIQDILKKVARKNIGILSKLSFYIYQTKKNRILADYKMKEISKEVALKSFDYAQKAIILIKENIENENWENI